MRILRLDVNRHGERYQMMYSKKSFTFIEIMVATLLFAIVLGPMIFSIGMFNKLARISNDFSVVSLAAQSKIDEMSVYDYSQLANDFDNETFDVPGLNNPSDGSENGLIEVEESNGLYDVKVTISWSSMGRDYSRTFNTTFVLKG